MCPDFRDLFYSISRGTYKNKDGQGLSPTKYFLGIVTSTVTLIAVPLIRIIIKANGSSSIIAETIFWFVTSFFGFAIIIYPWWLATSTSPIYYKRLRKYTVIIGIISFIFVIARGLLAPVEPFLYNEPKETSLEFRVVATLWYTASLGGFLLALPWLIRREKLLRSKSLALFTFVLPYVALMLVGVLLQVWVGFSAVTAYSPAALLALFGAVGLLEDRASKSNGKQFDEAYIIVAGMYTKCVQTAFLIIVTMNLHCKRFRPLLAGKCLGTIAAGDRCESGTTGNCLYICGVEDLGGGV